jgi:predicted transcriptional regulator
MVALTSREAYEGLKQSGKEGTQRGQILSCVLLFRSAGITRRGISGMTGLELGAVAGRVNDMVTDGWLRESGPIKCDVTGKWVGVVFPAERYSDQKELF